MLEDVCEILDSQRIPITASERKAGIYPYYGANGIQDYVDNYIFDDDLVLLAEDGGNFGSRDKPIAYRVSGKCWVNNHAHVLKPKSTINVDYLCYTLMFYDTTGLVNGATRQKLTQSAMRQMKIPFVKMDVQNEIVERINLVVDLIDKRKKQLEKLDELVKSRFIEMFGDKDFPKSTIGELVASKVSSVKKDFLPTDTIKYIDISSIDNKRNIMTGYTEYALEDAPSRAQQHIRKDDIVVSTVRPNLKNVAITGYKYDNLVASSGFCVLRAEKCLSSYLMAVVCSDNFTDAMTKVVTGANYPAIKDSDVRGYVVPNPPIELQQQFATFNEQVDKSKLEIKQSLEKLELLKKALMQKYFR